MTKAKTPWMYNSGLRIPVPSSSLVEVQLQDGFRDVGKAGDWYWEDCSYKIKKFRVVEDPNKPETNPCLEITLDDMTSIPEVEWDTEMDFESW